MSRVPVLPLYIIYYFQDSSQHVHLKRICHLLQQLVSTMKSHLPLFSLEALHCCHGACLHLLNDLLRTSSSQPSSLASTPTTPSPATPSTAGHSLPGAWPVQEPCAQSLSQELCAVLSSEGLNVFEICSKFLSFFASFLESRVIADGVCCRNSLQRCFSSGCQALILVAKLISKSEVVEGFLEGR